MFLNLHERWLLRRVGLRRAARNALLDAVRNDPLLRKGEIDLAAQIGGYNMTKRSVTADLENMFNRLISRNDLPVRAVAYGDRRYRREVIIAAALRQAGVSPENYRLGRSNGLRELDKYATVTLRDVSS
ncbi:MAG: hypothetical protein JWN95_2512 [Frankiales bacterium]|nr:hypothetical protein [Frankiales bacterium]